MGSVCQKGDGIINWPCQSNPRGSNPRATFTVIPEEDSVIYSQYDRSVFTASQFYQNPETQVMDSKQCRDKHQYWEVQLVGITNSKS